MAGEFQRAQGARVVYAQVTHEDLRECEKSALQRQVDFMTGIFQADIDFACMNH